MLDSKSYPQARGLTIKSVQIIIYVYGGWENKNSESAGSGFGGTEAQKDVVSEENGDFFYCRICRRVAVDDLGHAIKSSSWLIGVEFLAVIVAVLIIILPLG